MLDRRAVAVAIGQVERPTGQASSLDGVAGAVLVMHSEGQHRFAPAPDWWTREGQEPTPGSRSVTVAALAPPISRESTKRLG